MNSDQFAGILRIAVAAGVTWMAKKGYIPGIDKDMLVSDIVSLLTISAMSFWSHVRHAPPVVAAFIAGILALAPQNSYATDVIAKTPAKTPECASQVMCSGFYGYIGVGGNGSNADIVGSGLSGSIFANGTEFVAGGGYQYWNGKWFIAAEAGGGWNVPAGGQAVAIRDRGQAEIVMKLGYGLQGLFSTPAAPTTFSSLVNNVVSPYGIVGVRFRYDREGTIGGAGIQYYLGPQNTISAEYRHVNYNSASVSATTTVNTDNWVGLRFEHHL
jgi:hypothetical protein